MENNTRKKEIVFGGKGVRGEHIGFYEKATNPGYCSMFCRTIAEPNWNVGIHEED